MFRSGISRRSPIFLGPIRSTAFHRIVAKAIDGVLVLAVFFIGKAFWGPLGPLLGAYYAAFQDSMGGGQSVGKKIIGLRVLDDGTGSSCNALSSCMRNLPLVIAILFASVPVLWVFALFATVPFMLLEIYLVVALETGVRLGDIMANTLVVEHFEVHPEDLAGTPLS
jgi:uncharacterized RDD family membrane protein YckC